MIGVRGDWSLDYPGVTFPFGSVASGFGFHVAPETGVQSVIADDVKSVMTDGRQFGVDTLDVAAITFVADITAADEAAARTRHEQIRKVWRADTIRSKPGAVASLRSEDGRTTFGRPRRFSANTDAIHAGFIRVTADFVPVTDLWFGEVESRTVGLVPLPGGGLIAPLSSPLATTESSDRSQVIEVGGETPTPLSVTIHGPITNPVVEVVGVLRWELRTTLAYDQSVTIDAAPWTRTVLRDGAPIPGVVTAASTRLADALLPPGSHELVLRGTSSGAPRAVASWRPAFHTP